MPAKSSFLPLGSHFCLPAQAGLPVLAFPPVVSVFSVNSVVKSLFCVFLSRLLLLRSQQSNHFPAQLHHTLQSPSRHPQDLLKQSRHPRQKFQHALQPLPRVSIPLRTRLQLRHALRQNTQRRINLPPLPLLRDNPENLPHILDRLKVVAPVPHHMHHAHNSPPLQFPQARAHIRPCHRQRRRNLIRRQRLWRQKQQRVHLRDSSINSPPRPHLPPMQNEFLSHRRQRVLRRSFAQEFLLKNRSLRCLRNLPTRFSAAERHSGN